MEKTVYIYNMVKTLALVVLFSLYGGKTFAQSHGDHLMLGLGEGVS